MREKDEIEAAAASEAGDFNMSTNAVKGGPEALLAQAHSKMARELIKIRHEFTGIRKALERLATK